MTDGLSLKEYIDLRVGNLEEQLRVRADAIREALTLQASEYARRLDVLNHAHEEARNVQATYVPREVFEGSVKEVIAAVRIAKVEADLKMEAFNKELQELRDYKNNAQGRSTATAAAISFIMGIVVLIISIALHFIK